MSLFRLGRCLATPAAVRFCETHEVDLLRLLTRHASGDWGDMCAEDKTANDRALVDGSRIFSSYEFPAGKIWIITDATDDAGVRNATTAMLPSDY